MHDEDAHPWAAAFERWWAAHPAAWGTAINDFMDDYPNAGRLLGLLGILAFVCGCAGVPWLIVHVL